MVEKQQRTYSLRTWSETVWIFLRLWVYSVKWSILTTQRWDNWGPCPWGLPSLQQSGAQSCSPWAGWRLDRRGAGSYLSGDNLYLCHGHSTYRGVWVCVCRFVCDVRVHVCRYVYMSISIRKFEMAYINCDRWHTLTATDLILRCFLWRKGILTAHTWFTLVCD